MKDFTENGYIAREETLDDFLAELGILEECETLALAAIEKDLAKRAKKPVFIDNMMVI